MPPDNAKKQGTAQRSPFIHRKTPPFRVEFLNRPAEGVIAPPDWPPRPDIFDQVLLRKPITPERAHDAYMAWHLPDEDLGRVWSEWDENEQRPYRRPPSTDLDIHVLAHNVYEHLMSDPLLPTAYEDGERNFAAQGLDKQYDLSQNMKQTKQAAVNSGSLGFLDFCNLSQLQAQCEKRGLDKSGDAAALKARITTETMAKWSGMLVKSDLSHWGVERADKFTLEPWKRPKATALEMYTAAIQISPYNPTYWISRAYCHYLLGFFDLAIGDAYRAQILCDVLEQAFDRNKRPGFYMRIWEAIEAHLMAAPRDPWGNLKPEIERMRKPNGINIFVPTLQKSLHSIISLSLAGLNAWHDYNDHKKILDSRLGMPDRDVRVPQLRHTMSEKAAQIYHDETQKKKKLFFHERSAGAVPANRPYPFENQDFDRTSSTFLGKVNQNVFEGSNAKNKTLTPVCYADKVGEGQGIGVFAKDSIEEGTVIHVEEPTIRGHLPPRRLVNDLVGKAKDKNRCENCLKEITPAMLRQQQKANCVHQCPCSERWLRHPGSPGVMFCRPPYTRAKNSKIKSCLKIAKEVHHFSSCGKDWQWLYDSMRPVVGLWDEQEYISHTNEGHGTMLMLLLRNVFDIALHRRKMEPNNNKRLNPHEIDELLVLDGNSKTWRNSWFPFNMAANIKVPFDILESLGVDIFQRSEFDTWIFQIILRKLLVNTVPWDPRRQGEVSDRLASDRDKMLHTPTGQFRRMKDKEPLTDLDPSFQHLYLFPGLSLFNHSCADSHNADWGYDTAVPNRVIVWATKDIAEGEEIRIRYRNHAIKSERRGIRLFGTPCQCPRCLSDPPRPQTPDSENFSDRTYASGEDEAETHGCRDKGRNPGDDSDDEITWYKLARAAKTLEKPPAADAGAPQESKTNGSSKKYTQADIDAMLHKLVTQRNRAVVEDGKVVVYRDLTSPSDGLPRGERKRKIEPEEKDPYPERTIIDIVGNEIEVPPTPKRRASWARKEREKLAKYFEKREGEEDKEGEEWRARLPPEW